MSTIIYLLCGLTSLACAVLLLRSWRRSRSPMLMWSGLCFVGFTLNNALLTIDRVTGPLVDLSTARLVTGFASLMLLLIGLIWHND